MTRQELEQKAYDMLVESMQYNGTDDKYIWSEIKKASTETLYSFVMDGE